MTPQPILPILDAIRAHLTTRDLPEVVSIHISGGERRTLQLRGDLPLARSLLTWAATLTDVTVHAWRVPHGEFIHLSIRGAMAGGIWIEVYGAFTFTEHGIGADLPMGDSVEIPIDTLRGAL